jgi:hypothetical protein
LSRPVCIRSSMSIKPASILTLPPGVPSSYAACFGSISSPCAAYCFISGMPAPAVTWPCPVEVLAPALERSGVQHRRSLPLPPSLGDIDHIGVSIPDEMHRRGRVVIAEIKRAKVHPMPRDRIDGLAGDAFFRHREDAA